jgi:hypothetical protein
MKIKEYKEETSKLMIKFEEVVAHKTDLDALELLSLDDAILLREFHLHMWFLQGLKEDDEIPAEINKLLIPTFV